LVACDAVRFTRLGDDDQALGPRFGIVDPKSRHTAPSHARDLTRDFLNLLRIQVSSSFDNHVLPSRGHKEFSLSQISEVPGIDPILTKYLFCGLRILKVAHHSGGTTELDVALDTLRNRETLIVNYPNLVRWQGLADRDKT
jgi:hypothetical protein